MPVNYVVEMFMDRIAASKIYKKEAYTDASPLEYYQKGVADTLLHPDTRKLLEKLLVMLAEKGEKKTFAYIRANVLRKKRKGRRMSRW